MSYSHPPGSTKKQTFVAPVLLIIATLLGCISFCLPIGENWRYGTFYHLASYYSTSYGGRYTPAEMGSMLLVGFIIVITLTQLAIATMNKSAFVIAGVIGVLVGIFGAFEPLTQMEVFDALNLKIGPGIMLLVGASIIMMTTGIATVVAGTRISNRIR